MALKNHKAFFLLLFFIGYVFSFPASLVAQTLSPVIEQAVSESSGSAEALFACNDFYNEKDFRFFVSQSPKEALPGYTYTITGWVENYRQTLLSGATLYVKIKKSGTSESLERVESYAVVAKDLNINERGRVPASYSWEVPLGIPDGTYVADMFLTVGSDQVKIPVAANDIKITVNSGNKSKLPIALTSANTTVSKDLSQESINLVFANNQSKTDAVPVTIKMYKGDFARGTPIETINRVVDLSKGISSSLTVGITNYRFAKKTFVVEYPSEGRLNNLYIFHSGDKTVKDPALRMAGLANFKNTPVAYVCAEPISFSKITRTKLELKIFDKENNIIKQLSRDRIATSSDGAIKIDLMPDDVSKIVAGARIESNLFVGNLLEDSILINYECKDSKNIICGGNGGTNDSKANIDYGDILITLGVLAVLFWAGSFLMYRKVKSSRGNTLMLFFGIGILLVAPNVVTADWRTELKDFANTGGSAPLIVDYQFDQIFGDYFHSNYAMSCTPPSNPNCTVYQSGVGSGNGVVYSAFMRNSTPIPFDSSIVSSYNVYLPIRIGVAVLDNSQFSADNYTFSQFPSGMLAANLTLVNDNPGPANWDIPIGARVGFYVNSEYDTGFGWDPVGWNEWVRNWSYHGWFVDTLPANLGGCYTDTYTLSNGTPQTATPCTPYQSASDYFSLAFRLIPPTVTIQGLDNFDCEAMQSDGTMECVAARLGPSTPYVVIGNTLGRLYGASSFGVYETGTCTYSNGVCRFASGFGTPHYLSNNIVYSSPLTITNGSTASFYNPYSSDPDLVERAEPTILGDGLPGILLPTKTFQPFGYVTVIPRHEAPTAITISTLDTYSQGGYAGFLFEAVGTDSDDRMRYQIDWNLDDNYDTDVYLTSYYYNATSSQYERQPGYVDPWTHYASSGSPLRFDGTFYDTGTSTFAVRAIDEQGLTSDWMTHSVFVPTPPPPVDTFNVETASSCGQGISLSWNNVSGIDGYYIYRYSYESGEYENIATVPSGTLTYEDTTLTYPDYGYYMIRTYSSDGVSLETYNSAYAADPCTTVEPPTNFTAVADPDTCGGKINMTWTAASGATGYNLYRLNNNTGVWVSIANPTGTSYNDTVSPGVLTYYRIRSHNADNTIFSTYVNANTVSSAPCDGPPGDPSNLSAISSSSCGGKIDFSWTAANNADGYYLYVLNNFTGEYSKIATITGQTTYTLNQGNQSVFRYLVSAFNSDGESSGFSNSVLGTPSGVCNPECSDGINNDVTEDSDIDSSDTGCYLPDGVTYDPTDNLEQFAACLRDGIVISNGETRRFFIKKIVPQAQICNEYMVDLSGVDTINSKLLRCENGVLYDESNAVDDGSLYRYATCRSNVDYREQ